MDKIREIFDDKDLISSLNGVQYQRLVAYVSNLHQDIEELEANQEESYRRGYHQGFFNATQEENKNISLEDVRSWRYDRADYEKHSCPPGSMYCGDRLYKKTR